MKKYTLFLLMLCFIACQSMAQCSLTTYFSYFNNGNSYFFQDETTGTDSSATYLWDFGDGQTSTEINPSHTYAAVGNYSVCETVTNNDITSCSSQYCFSISTCTITPSFGITPLSLFTYIFTDSSTGEDSTSITYWHFGDGDSSYDQSPTHTFVPDGIFSTIDSYYVCLDDYTELQDCHVELCQYVYITCPAVADFTFTNSGTYNYTFADASTGEDNSSTYIWSFGDGDSSASKNPSHTFTHVANYSVCLTIINSDQSCSNQICKTIAIVCPVQAGFSETNTGLYNYSFVNTSTGTDGLSTYSWDFGDGNSSTSQSPEHIFDTVGSYNTCLTVTDPALSCSSQSCNNIDIVCPGSALYTYAIDTNGLTYHFTDSSTGENGSTTFLWNFGNGANSTSRNPDYTFPVSGSYNVCLDVNNVNLGCVNQYCFSIPVCPVTTHFTYTHGDIYTYQFTDVSTGEGSGDTYLWVFGDGDTSYVQNPQHVFTGQSDYNVCFTVSSSSGGCTNTNCNTVAVTCPAVAQFSYAIDPDGYTYSFVDQSAGEDSSTSYLWDFGTGDSSSLQNPTIKFPDAKTYTVCLTVTDSDQNCSSIICNEINVCRAVSYFTYTTSDTYTWHFADASTGEDSTATYLWDFGDGQTSQQKNPVHVFSSLGTFSVCLTITQPDLKCNSQYCANLTVNCQAAASFNFSNSSTYTVNFADASTGTDASTTYSWTFGDGVTSTARNPSHTYTTAGNYTACLTVTNVDQDCSSTAYCLPVAICPSSANFGFVSNTLYDYQFNDSSSGENASSVLTWSFGDGDSSQIQNPEHIYLKPGTYSVCLTLADTTLNCYTQYCSAVSVACPDTANFIYYAVIGWEYNFTDLSTGEDSTTTFSWSFGDGGTSNQQLPTHKFDSAGTYSVCLTIVNNDLSCVNQFCSNVIISCTDTAAFIYTANNFQVSFQDQSVGEDDSVTYLWDFGDNTSSTEQNPVHSFHAPQTFNVCLNLGNADQQCPSQFCQDITFSCPDSGNAGISFIDSVDNTRHTFIDQSTGTIDTVSYLWDFGDGDTSTEKEPTHIYGTTGQFIVCMTLSQTNIGCVNQICDTIQVLVAGLSQISPEEIISLYPNPASGKAYIDMKDLVAGQIQIYNNLGQQVQFIEPGKSGIISLDIAEFPAGIYNVRIAIKNGAVANMKMVISY